MGHHLPRGGRFDQTVNPKSHPVAEFKGSQLEALEPKIQELRELLEDHAPTIEAISELLDEAQNHRGAGGGGDGTIDSKTFKHCREAVKVLENAGSVLRDCRRSLRHRRSDIEAGDV